MPHSSARAGLSGTALKRIACVSMLLDHIGASCLEAGALRLPELAALWQPLARADLVLRWCGRLAFPLYCFLLAEGFAHTRSWPRYAARLALFGLLSELPFDWAFFNTPFYWGHQNVYWTLLLGLLALAALRRFLPGPERPARPSGGAASAGEAALGVLCALGCALLAEGLRTDYGAIGVLLIVALAQLRGRRAAQCAAAAAITLYEPPAPLAAAPMWFYNGRRGDCGRAQRWAFYVFYPAHLAVLGCVTNLVVR